MCPVAARLADQPLKPTDADEAAVGRHNAVASVDAATFAGDAALTGSTQRRHARPVRRRPQYTLLAKRRQTYGYLSSRTERRRPLTAV